MLVQKMAALSANMPEDIMKKKWAGDYEGALQLIDFWLCHHEWPEQELRLESVGLDP